jgi:L-alanine-DL-glutamate epimerase-like enolase superfamily enzyme
MPNFIITEFFVNLNEWAQTISDHPFVVKDGHIDLPTRPGLGIDLKVEALEASAYQPFPARHRASPGDER